MPSSAAPQRPGADQSNGVSLDRDAARTGTPRSRNRAATRLPVPVISAHALLGLGGLMLWIGYLLLNQKELAWATFAALGTVAVLGLVMAARWVRVYRTVGNPGPSLTRDTIVPPERNFPLPVVVLHGLLAVTTLVLVLFTAIGNVRS